MKNQAVDILHKKSPGLKKSMQPRQAYKVKKKTTGGLGVNNGHATGFGSPSGRDSIASQNQ